MVLRVELPEGPFLADVGFGGLGLTAPLAVRLNVEQTTPHETMRLVPAGEELTLQAKLGENWENMYRLLPQPGWTPITRSRIGSPPRIPTACL